MPINYRDFWVIEKDGINYYLIDLRKQDIHFLKDILTECANIEKESWRAQEDFSEYITKCDALCYAVTDNRIVGFTAGRAVLHGAICMHCSDETMVLRDFRSRNIAKNMVFSCMRWGLRTMSFKDTEHFVFLAISSNPRIINAFYKYSHIIKVFFDCSFKPSGELIEVLEIYRNMHKISLVDRNYPFCLKNMFPGSNTFNPAEKRFLFLDMVKNSMPRNFDHMKRGDAFAFLVKVPRYVTHAFVFILMVLSFGRNYFSRKGIGFFARKD